MLVGFGVVRGRVVYPDTSSRVGGDGRRRYKASEAQPGLGFQSAKLRVATDKHFEIALTPIASLFRLTEAYRPSRPLRRTRPPPAVGISHLTRKNHSIKGVIGERGTARQWE